jgi:hypothetical protein
MTDLVDHLARNLALLDREVSKEIARRVASFDAQSREIERKFDAIEKRFAHRAARSEATSLIRPSRCITAGSSSAPATASGAAPESGPRRLR